MFHIGHLQPLFYDVTKESVQAFHTYMYCVHLQQTLCITQIIFNKNSIKYGNDRFISAVLVAICSIIV